MNCPVTAADGMLQGIPTRSSNPLWRGVVPLLMLKKDRLNADLLAFLKA